MKKLFSIVICVMALLFASCEPNDPATSSKVETGAASDITPTSAVLHGVVNVDISQYDDVEFGMMISKVKDDLNNLDGEKYEAKVLIGIEFKLELKKLSPETEYYYCAWAFLNNTQYELGDIKKFTTVANPKSAYKAMPFSVSSSKQVYLSPGNLQYTQSTNTWSFAENQYDYIGTDNVTGGSVTSDQYDGDEKLGTDLADKVDLFCFSTAATNFGISTSTDYNDYSGSFVDWGTNKIGTDAPNTWRTLTHDEWEYLLDNRNNASSLRGVAQVNCVNGLIFLPDNWTCPAGVTFKSGFHNEWGVDYYAAYQTFTAAEWSKLEAAGAVFLPAAGIRDGSDVGDVQSYGCYWSANGYNSSSRPYCLKFESGEAYMDDNGRYEGSSVRLVKDLQ